MSHLDHIVSEVKAKGRHEESWNILLNAYFRGEDGFEQIRAWAKSAGLSATFDDHYRTCIFQAAGGQSAQTRHT